ncbi:hypothetical protein [Romboutsia sp.]|uniref:hypothetical protein n=1 Tax=Romboutsia sp. TaxID=1965302 RepID=UPI003F322CA8
MFLKNFDKRMKKVGAYSVLIKNAINRTTWKNYYFNEYYEQINLIFVVLLFIMEESLKDNTCTIDDIGNFIDEVNTRSFKKPLSYEDCIEFANFIVNTVLCDDGKTMYFNGYDFDNNDYKEINISYLSNKIVYINDAQRRVSYHLSDEGYNLILSTLEIENNLNITIQEIIFKLHLEKADYDRAVDDIKQMFSLMRIQLQKMNDAIKRIRHNVLNYSIEEYKNLLNENIDSLGDIRKKLTHHREHVEEKIKELKERDINVKKLEKNEIENLKNLSIIERYLNQSIEEQQGLLSAHFDFKAIYSRELEEMTSMSIIKRFNIQSDLYEKILENSEKLDNLDYILRPLFLSPNEKNYNINKCLQYQRKIVNSIDEEDEEISFEEIDYLKEKEERAKEKLKKYELTLKTLLNLIINENKSNLLEVSKETIDNEELKESLIPNIEIFREVIIELLKARELNINELKEERKNSINDINKYEFNLTHMVLDLIESNIEYNFIDTLNIEKNVNNTQVKFYEVKSDDKIIKTLNCSDIIFTIN